MKSEVAQAIAQHIESNQHNEILTSLCSCGAITMSVFENSDSIAFLSSNAPYIKPTDEGINQNCNHCANNWGVDIVDHSEEISQIEEAIREREEQIEDLEKNPLNAGQIQHLKNIINNYENKLSDLEN